MRRSNITLMTAFTAGLAMTATSVFALPTDMGRSADVYTNAVRYFAALPVPEAPTPKLRPDYFADLVADPIEEPIEVAAAEETAPVVEDNVEVVVTALAGPVGGPDGVATYEPSDPIVLADVAVETEDSVTDVVEAISVEDPIVEDVVEVSAPAEIIVADAPSAPVAPVFTYESDSYATAHTVEASVSPDSVQPVAPIVLDGDNIFAAVETESPAFEVETLAVEIAEDDTVDVGEDVVAAAAVATPAPPSAGSSRFVGSPHPEVFVTASDVATANGVVEEDADIMSQIVDADENLIIREGGGDDPDTMMMSSDVLFSFGKAELADEALATLSTIVDLADEVPVIEIFGHTDAIGSESNNLALGQRRAEAVRDWLLDNSAFTQDRVIATGVGEVDPVAPNFQDNGDDNPEGRAQNRRVEFAFTEASADVEVVPEAE